MFESRPNRLNSSLSMSLNRCSLPRSQCERIICAARIEFFEVVCDEFLFNIRSPYLTSNLVLCYLFIFDAFSFCFRFIRSSSASICSSVIRRFSSGMKFGFIASFLIDNFC